MRLILIAVLLLSSCAKQVATPHPGAINAFDSNAYDILITEQASIEQAKADIAKYPAMKTSLNAVIAQYDTTMAAYKIYHAAAATGTSVDTSNLQAQINSLVVNVTSLIKGMVK